MCVAILLTNSFEKHNLKLYLFFLSFQPTGEEILKYSGSWSWSTRLLVFFCELNFITSKNFWNKGLFVPFLYHIFEQIWKKNPKIVCLSWNLATRQNRICWIQLLKLIWPRILFLDKFGPKNQNCLFKMKLGTYHPSQNILRSNELWLLWKV